MQQNLPLGSNTKKRFVCTSLKVHVATGIFFYSIFCKDCNYNILNLREKKKKKVGKTGKLADYWPSHLPSLIYDCQCLRLQVT